MSERHREHLPFLADPSKDAVSIRKRAEGELDHLFKARMTREMEWFRYRIQSTGAKIEPDLRHPQAFLKKMQERYHGDDFEAIEQALRSHPDLLLQLMALEARQNQVQLLREEKGAYIFGESGTLTPFASYSAMHQEVDAVRENMGAAVMDLQTFRALNDVRENSRNSQCFTLLDLGSQNLALSRYEAGRGLVSYHDLGLNGGMTSEVLYMMRIPKV